MYHKALITALVVGTLAGCVDNDAPRATSDDKSTVENNDNPISSGRLTHYFCKDLIGSDRLDDVRATFNIKARTKRKISQTMPDFKMARDHFKEYALYEADISYYTFNPDPNNLGSYVKQNIFKYKNVDFKYDNGDLILTTPVDDGLPTCQIWFKKTSKNSEHKIGKHRCKFEKNDMGYRAENFDFSCGREGKIRMFSEPKL